MEEMKQGWKKRASWLVIAIIVIVFYKILDNFGNIHQWITTFLRILRPFLVGLLISYILYIPSKKIETFFKKSKIKVVKNHSRGLSVLLTYILAVLVIILVINCILPVLRDSIIEFISNIQNYYGIVVKKFVELPEDSILKNDIIKDRIVEIQRIDLKQFITLSNEKIVEYAKNVINIFSGIFDVFVSIVVSIYILLQRNIIINFLGRLSRAIFKKDAYKAINKYFIKANEVFFTFVTSQLVDAILVGVLTTIVMAILKVKYAPLLGFMIGLFNMIPFVGAIVAVVIAIIITLITGGLGKTIAMALIVIVLQQIDANIINPKIVGHSLKVSPLLVLFAVTVGGAYFGIVGMFLAVPIAVVIKTILCDYVDWKNQLRDEEELIK